MRESTARGAALGLSEDEVAFYDALEVNDSAVKVLGEPTLKDIARELVVAVKNNVTIDWTVSRERASPAPRDCEADSSEVRLPARQAREGDSNSTRTG